MTERFEVVDLESVSGVVCHKIKITTEGDSTGRFIEGDAGEPFYILISETPEGYLNLAEEWTYKGKRKRALNIPGLWLIKTKQAGTFAWKFNCSEAYSVANEYEAIQTPETITVAGKTISTIKVTITLKIDFFRKDITWYAPGVGPVKYQSVFPSGVSADLEAPNIPDVQLPERVK